MNEKKLNEAVNATCQILDNDPACNEVRAALEYLKRKHRLSHPDGDFDNARRFDLSDEERRPCCTLIRAPSRTYPYPEMAHARTITHVSELFDVDALDVRRLARKIEAAAS